MFPNKLLMFLTVVGGFVAVAAFSWNRTAALLMELLLLDDAADE